MRHLRLPIPARKTGHSVVSTISWTTRMSGSWEHSICTVAPTDLSARAEKPTRYFSWWTEYRCAIRRNHRDTIDLMKLGSRYFRRSNTVVSLRYERARRKTTRSHSSRQAL